MKLDLALKLFELLPPSKAKAKTVSDLVDHWPYWDASVRPENRRRIMSRWLSDLDDFLGESNRLVRRTTTNPQRWFRDAQSIAAAFIPNEAAMALLVAGQVFDRMIGQEGGMELGEIQNALRNKLTRHANNLGRVADAIRFMPDGITRIDAQVAPEVIQAVIEAIARQRVISFNYQNTRGKISEPTVSPLGMIAKDRIRYLVGGEGLGGSIRHYALHRIRHVSVGLQPMAVPRNFNLDRHLDSVIMPSSRWPELRQDRYMDLHLRVRDSILYQFRELPLDSTQVISEQPDKQGWLELRSEALYSAQLVSFLLSFGDKVEVVSPTILREEISAHVKSLGDIYSNLK